MRQEFIFYKDTFYFLHSAKKRHQIVLMKGNRHGGMGRHNPINALYTLQNRTMVVAGWGELQIFPHLPAGAREFGRRR